MNQGHPPANSLRNQLSNQSQVILILLDLFPRIRMAYKMQIRFIIRNMIHNQPKMRLGQADLSRSKEDSYLIQIQRNLVCSGIIRVWIIPEQVMLPTPLNYLVVSESREEAWVVERHHLNKNLLLILVLLLRIIDSLVTYLNKTLWATKESDQT